MSKELNHSNVPAFALAGRSTITLLSGESGHRFTYKIQQCKDNDQLYFVHLLYGQDNERDYRYTGCYYADTKAFVPVKNYRNSPQYSWPPSLRAINFFFARMYAIPDNLHVYHEGKCGRCGRKLITPESIERGIGPECNKLNGGLNND